MPLTDAQLQAIELQPGERVFIRYRVIQGGTWFVAYEAERIAQAMEQDGRATVLSYEYQPDHADGPCVTFKLEISGPNFIQSGPVFPGQTSFAVTTTVVLTGLALTGIIMAAASAWLYGQVLEFRRETQAVLTEVITDPGSTEAETVAAIEALGNEPEPLADKVVTGATVAVIAGLILYFLTKG